MKEDIKHYRRTVVIRILIDLKLQIDDLVNQFIEGNIEVNK